jgi:catechol 2,3-dioxygenase-like lactoylglutathione lyase family enzyme
MPFRIMVKDKNQAVAWYQQVLGFEIQEEWGPAFAILAKGSDILWISGPQTSAAQPMPDGAIPTPGGWNRVVVEVPNLDVAIENLKQAGTVFRNEPVSGPGGTQVLVEDPSGNPVEVFQAR